MKLTPLLTLIALLKISTVFGQCTNQVTHTSGSATINGVQVTVTSHGNVDVNTTYCVNTVPYIIGYNSALGSGNGAYHFSFSPAVDSITMNFSGVSYSGVNQEIVELTVNGQHYAIPSVGTPNGCDPLAELTASGDITGCANCGVSGWSGTVIAGPISTLTVLDSAISGFGNGAIFSLFLCGSEITHLEQNERQDISSFFPNPMVDEATLFFEGHLQNASLIVCNSLGQEVKRISHISGQTLRLQRDHLPGGLYFYQITEENRVIGKGKLVMSE